MTNLLEETAALQRHQAQWQVIVKNLADEFSCPISQIEEVLSTAEHQLAQEARIKVFVPLLAIKQVKDLMTPYKYTPRRHVPRELTHP